MGADNGALPGLLHGVMRRKKIKNANGLAKALFGEEVTSQGYRAGRARGIVASWLKGAALPNPENIAKISDTFGVARTEIEAAVQADLLRKRPAFIGPAPPTTPAKAALVPITLRIGTDYTLSTRVPISVARELTALVTNYLAPLTDHSDGNSTDPETKP